MRGKKSSVCEASRVWLIFNNVSFLRREKKAGIIPLNRASLICQQGNGNRETYRIRLVFIPVFLLFHVQSVAAFTAIQETGIGPQISGVRPTYLAMNKDYRSQKPPCSSLTVHMEHAQDLEETYASESTTPAKPSLLIPDVTSLSIF